MVQKSLAHTVQLQRVSSIARSASLLGSCMVAGIGTIAGATELNAYDVIPWDGNGGGTGNTIFKPGGTQAITTTSTVATQFTITWSVTCNGDSDQMNCTAFLFQFDGQILSPATMQGACVGSQFTGTFTSPADSCASGTTYNVNFACLNQTTQTATLWGDGTTATVTCL